MSMDDQCLDLPPGFRFHPTDEEIITYYLSPKVINHGDFSTRAVGEVDLNKCEPWDLPSRAKMGEKEWYFFCQRDRKYPTGMRTNRATESGYWKATGKDKEIYRDRGVLVGMKKTLVFYRGRAPKGVKTNWVMHEFRLETKSSFSNLPKPTKDEWVVSKVFNKSNGLKKNQFLGDVNGFTNELMESPTLPPLMDPTFLNSGAVNVDNFDASSVMANCAQLNNYSFPSLNDIEDYSQLTLNNRLTSAYCSSSSSNPPLNQNSGFFRRSQDQGGAPVAVGGRYCKAEQFSGQSMVSQDTGDRGTEITSVISKMNMGSCASYDRDGGGAMDLANMWRC